MFTVKHIRISNIHIYGLSVDKVYIPDRTGIGFMTSATHDAAWCVVGEVLCGDHDHTGFTSLEDVYFIPVDTMLQYLFSDNQFYRDFTASRKTTGEK